MDILWKDKVLGVYSENTDCELIIRHRGHVLCYFVDGPKKGMMDRLHLIKTGVGYMFPDKKEFLVCDKLFSYRPAKKKDEHGYGTEDYEPGGVISMYMV